MWYSAYVIASWFVIQPFICTTVHYLLLIHIKPVLNPVHLSTNVIAHHHFMLSPVIKMSTDNIRVYHGEILIMLDA